MLVVAGPTIINDDINERTKRQSFLSIEHAQPSDYGSIAAQCQRSE
jgi:hypothetical protein